MSEYYFNYDKEPRDDILCVDMKSFFASVECVERGLNPLKTMLVVMSNAENGGGLALATSPMAKKVLGISNVTRKYDMPYHKDLLIVPPRMNLYIQKNLVINNIFRQYVSDEDILIYSIDETFIRITASKKLFHMNVYEFAVQFQREIYHETGLFCTIGIGDNPLLSKLALDNEAKKNKDMIATWRYEDVPNTVWQIKNMTDFWGINTRTEKALNNKGIYSIKELANYDYFSLKASMGIMGEQLFAHSWGVDRTKLSDVYIPKSKSIGNSQVLMKDYTDASEIKIVIREIAEQVATRLRSSGKQTACVRLTIGYSRFDSERGFNRQTTIQPTNQSKELTAHCMRLFDKFYNPKMAVRNIAVSYSKLTDDTSLQLNLFDEPTEVIANKELDEVVDTIRNRYGFSALVHASSQLEGGTALSRASRSLVGGHAGGCEGINQ